MAKEDEVVDPVQQEADARAQVGHEEGDPGAEGLAEAAEQAEAQREERGGKRLTRHVHVNSPNGTRTVFGPEDDLPDWAHEAITNPKAFENIDRSDADPEIAVPGPNQFVVNGVPVRSRDDLYAMEKRDLLDLADAAGIDGLTMRDTKQDIVESITAR